MNLKNKVPRKPKRSHRQSASSRSYASAQTHAILNGLIGIIIIAFISFYFFLTPLNPQPIGLLADNHSRTVCLCHIKIPDNGG